MKSMFAKKNVIFAKKNMILVILLTISFCLASSMSEKVYAGETVNNSINTENPPIMMETDKVAVVIEYGWENHARYGRYAVFSAEIYSKTLTGQYELNLYFGNSENENVKYGEEVTLTPENTTDVKLTIPMYQEILNIRSELTDIYDNTVVESVDHFYVSNYGTNKVIGILTDSPQEMGYFSLFGCKCFYIDQNNFPDDKDGLDMLDIIVIDGFDCSNLSEEQFTVLQDYVKKGGSLVIGTGERTEDMRCFMEHDMLSIEEIKSPDEINHINVTEQQILFGDEESFSSLLESINTYENSRISTMNKMQERSETYGIDLTNAYVGDSMLDGKLLSDLVQEPLKSNIAEFHITDASIINSTNEAGVLAQKKLYGQGSILVFSFRLANQSFINGNNAAPYEIVKLILDNLNGAIQQKLEVESYGSIESLYSNGVINISENAAVPILWIYLITLIIYIVIIGPVLFLLLKHFKASKYIWGIVPLISSIFVIIVYAEGNSTRITKPYVSYYSIERLDSEKEKVTGNVAFELSFPQNKDSSVTLSGTNKAIAGEVSFPQYEIYYSDSYLRDKKYMDLSGYHLGVVNKDNEIHVEINDTPSFYKNYMEAEYEYDSFPAIESDISFRETGPEGTLKNISGETMKNCFFYCDGILVSLGEVAPGQVVHIENYPLENIINVESVYYSELIDALLEQEDGKQTEPKSARQNQALREIIEMLQREEQAAYLITFQAEASVNNPISELTDNRGSYGTNVKLISLDVSYDNENRRLVPDIDSYMEITKEAYEYLLYYRYMLSDTIEVSYRFPQTDDMKEIMVSGLLNYIRDYEEASEIGQRIYFYNNETKVYDLVFDLKNWKDIDENGKFTVQRMGVEELIKYLTDENMLKVKYESGISLDEVAVLPRISYVKEVSHAED